jgi:hypothetical protein
MVEVRSGVRAVGGSAFHGLWGVNHFPTSLAFQRCIPVMYSRRFSFTLSLILSLTLCDDSLSRSVMRLSRSLSYSQALSGSVTGVSQALFRARGLSQAQSHSRSLSVTGLSTTPSGPHSFLG